MAQCTYKGHRSLLGSWVPAARKSLSQSAPLPKGGDRTCVQDTSRAGDRRPEPPLTWAHWKGSVEGPPPGALPLLFPQDMQPHPELCPSVHTADCCPPIRPAVSCLVAPPTFQGWTGEGGPQKRWKPLGPSGQGIPRKQNMCKRSTGLTPHSLSHGEEHS